MIAPASVGTDDSTGNHGNTVNFMTSHVVLVTYQHSYVHVWQRHEI